MKSNIELLLMLTENAQADGDELVTENNKMYAAHARKLWELSQMLDHARTLLTNEMNRFQRWMPIGEANAAQIGVVQGDNQREHPRVGPPRQSATLAQTDSGNRPSERPTHPPLGTQAGTQAKAVPR